LNSLAILFHYLCTQHVSNINISIIRLKPATRTLLKHSRIKSPTHNEPRTKRPM